MLEKVATLVGLIISTYSVIGNIVYKGNNTITELRAILQRESQNS